MILPVVVNRREGFLHFSPLRFIIACVTSINNESNGSYTCNRSMTIQFYGIIGYGQQAVLAEQGQQDLSRVRLVNLVS